MHKYSLWPKSIGQKLMALGGALISIPLLGLWNGKDLLGVAIST